MFSKAKSKLFLIVSYLLTGIYEKEGVLWYNKKQFFDLKIIITEPFFIQLINIRMTTTILDLNYEDMISQASCAISHNLLI